MQHLAPTNSFPESDEEIIKNIRQENRNPYWWRIRENRSIEPNAIEKYGSYAVKYHRAILELLGAKCKRCGFNDKRALQIDHINGGGTKERLQHGGSYNRKVLEKIMNGSDEYQILCANCNWIKRYMRNENS